MDAPEIEIVLATRCFGCLAYPVLLLGADGRLLFANVAAEAALSLRFEETGPQVFDEWRRHFVLSDGTGRVVAREDRPEQACLRARRSILERYVVNAHRPGRFDADIMAWPLIDRGGGVLAATVMLVPLS